MNIIIKYFENIINKYIKFMFSPEYNLINLHFFEENII